MNKKNIWEIIGFGLLIIAGLSFLSEKLFYIENLTEIYNHRDLILFLGFGIHLIGGWQSKKGKSRT